MTRSDYEDIIGLPHHESAVHPRMSLRDRAAQFAPFSALTGYEEALEEVSRITEEKKELGRGEQAELNRRLNFLKRRLGDRPEIAVCFFQPDGRKSGGAYRTVRGRLKAVSEAGQLLVLEDGTEIRLEDISALDGPVFQEVNPDLFLQ